jgi:hypothetical protein
VVQLDVNESEFPPIKVLEEGLCSRLQCSSVRGAAPGLGDCLRHEKVWESDFISHGMYEIALRDDRVEDSAGCGDPGDAL